MEKKTLLKKLIRDGKGGDQAIGSVLTIGKQTPAPEKGMTPVQPLNPSPQPKMSPVEMGAISQKQPNPSIDSSITRSPQPVVPVQKRIMKNDDMIYTPKPAPSIDSSITRSPQPVTPVNPITPSKPTPSPIDSLVQKQPNPGVMPPTPIPPVTHPGNWIGGKVASPPGTYKNDPVKSQDFAKNIGLFITGNINSIPPEILKMLQMMQKNKGANLSSSDQISILNGRLPLPNETAGVDTRMPQNNWNDPRYMGPRPV